MSFQVDGYKSWYDTNKIILSAKPKQSKNLGGKRLSLKRFLLCWSLNKIYCERYGLSLFSVFPFINTNKNDRNGTNQKFSLGFLYKWLRLRVQSSPVGFHKWEWEK